MTHPETILRALVRYDRPPDEVLAELEGYDPESGEVTEEQAEPEDEVEIELTPDDAIAVLTRFVEGDLNNEELDHWADVVLNHDAIVLEDDHREPLAALLDEMPDLSIEAAEEWIVRLDPDG